MEEYPIETIRYLLINAGSEYSVGKLLPRIYCNIELLVENVCQEG